ncbi:MAG: c-type cytochrome [Proteobacteria bacterium]|nr:c-type cytochrome [Pseudomonadota bacterium]
MSKQTIRILAFLSAIVLAAVGCGGDDDGGECPDNSTADQMMGAMLIASQCQGCHLASLTGAARNNAPPNVNFDTAEDVMNREGRIRARAIDSSGMPPGGGLTQAQKDLVEIYLDCGAMQAPAAPMPFGECPDTSTADQTMGAMIVANKCNGCHSANLTGADRDDAPVGIDFDTAANVQARAARIYARSVDGSTMPPGGNALTADEKEKLRIYLACGATQTPTP